MRYIHKNDIYTVLHYSGQIMEAVGFMCLVPVIVDLIYGEANAHWYILVGLFSIVIGYLINQNIASETKNIRLKHGMAISSFAWLWAALMGGITFELVTNIGILNGIFESMSALTGTGVTMYNDVEILPQSVLFFRAFQQWIGGLGVVLMIIGVITRPGAATMKLYKSEAHEDRLKPSVKNTLRKTLKIYFIYTIIGIILYVIAGMPLFDSICNTFSTISTAGMSIKNDQMGFYNSDLIYIISMVLMILGATSFLTHYKMVKTKGRAIFKDVQFKTMIAIIAVSFIIIYATSNIIPMHSLFAIVSAVTSTGASIDTSQVMGTWPIFPCLIIAIAMIIGGSSGSTSGGVKLIRAILFIKGIIRRVKESLSPEGRIIPIKISGVTISDKEVYESGNYIALYLIFIIITWSIFCLLGYDPFKSLFGVISLQGNVGLDLGIITNSLDPILKVAAIGNMWVGRLEIFPVLVTLAGIYKFIKK